MPYIDCIYNASLLSNEGARKSRITREFLFNLGLHPDSDSDVTINLMSDDDELLATASLVKNVIKFVGVSPAAQGTGACATVMSELVSYAYREGIIKLFLFTKPDNEQLFRSLGFYTLAKTDSAVMMENDRRGLEKYIDTIKRESAGFLTADFGVQGAIVANCNPITNGHLYLMQNAARECATLHVFILSEDKSEFPASVRYELVKRATADVTNLCLHTTSDYMISQATFPRYFIKDPAQADCINADLDLTLFATRIAPALGITKRFVGTEPYCAITNAYNARMKELLPKYGVAVFEIERIGEISASKVREYMHNGDLASIKDIVPTATYEYIVSRKKIDCDK